MMKIHILFIDDVIAYSKPENFDWKAAPWWVQKEEAAKRKCQSSCTLNSRGVNTRVNLCDDKEVKKLCYDEKNSWLKCDYKTWHGIDFLHIAISSSLYSIPIM
jgi:hypothetical protein